MIEFNNSGNLINNIIGMVNFPSKIAVVLHGISFFCFSNFPESIHRLQRYLPDEQENETYHPPVHIYHYHDSSIIEEFQTVQRKFTYHRDIQTFPSVWHREYLDQNNDTFLYQPGNSSKYFIIRQDNIIIIITGPNASQPERLLLYIFREIIYRLSENRGAICFHAASFAFESSGILILGEQGTGKTTLLLSFLEHLNAKYISNDRTFVYPESLKCGTYPIPIRIARGTAVNSQALLNYLENNYQLLKREQLVSISELKQFQAAGFKEITKLPKIELEPVELKRCFNVTLAESHFLSGIIMPQFDTSFQQVKVERITGSDIGRLLNKECYTPNDPLWINPWIQRRSQHPDILRKNAAEVMQKICEKVPVFRLTFGPNLNQIIYNEGISILKEFQLSKTVIK